MARMETGESHPEALPNYEAAFLPEGKVRYPLRHPTKHQPFATLGFSEERGNWRELRARIVEALPAHPATFRESTEWGHVYYVDVVIDGPAGKAAPVRTGWIYLHGEDFPRLTTLYVKTTEWRRWEREGRI
ncbi:MAG: hypothetical protein M3R38_17220 [Actinomycetota bacterium]|nr:hypothetical protein [Actinomycetota bacterium]